MILFFVYGIDQFYYIIFLRWWLGWVDYPVSQPIGNNDSSSKIAKPQKAFLTQDTSPRPNKNNSPNNIKIPPVPAIAPNILKTAILKPLIDSDLKYLDKSVDIKDAIINVRSIKS